MKTLLKKIEIITYKYSMLKQENNFNVFEILRKKDDEVYLHSAFIKELLDINGSHGMGDVFLKLFIAELGLNQEEETISFKTKVFTEKYIGEIRNEKTEGGFIDIIIENIGKFPIIIENKINAQDQENQLLRYYNYNKDARLYYLTLDGKEPSPESLGTLKKDRVQLLSYRYNINNWLSNCIERSVKKPKLREAIIQYQDLVNVLTGNSTTMEERKEIIELLSENDNIIKAHKIAENWVHVRWHTEWDFWTGMENYIKNNANYKIVDVQKYSADLISGAIHQSRNRNPWYGLAVNIGNFKGSDIYMLIERGFDDLYYGLKVENKNILKEVGDLISDFCEDSQNTYWAGTNYFEPRINFHSFSNKKTLMLRNKQEQEKSIIECWNQIDDFIDKCRVKLNL